MTTQFVSPLMPVADISIFLDEMRLGNECEICEFAVKIPNSNYCEQCEADSHFDE